MYKLFILGDIMYMTDKQRVEYSIPPAILRTFVSGGIVNDDPDKSTMMDLLGKSLMEPIDNIDDKKRLSIKNRVLRVVTPVTDEYVNVDSLRVLTMSVYWLKLLLDSNVLILRDGSAFARATDLLLPILTKEKNFDQVNVIASQDATVFANKIKAYGYYGNFVLEEY